MSMTQSTRSATLYGTFCIIWGPFARIFLQLCTTHRVSGDVRCLVAMFIGYWVLIGADCSVLGLYRGCAVAVPWLCRGCAVTVCDVAVP